MHLVRSADLQPERFSQELVWYRHRFHMPEHAVTQPAMLRVTADNAYQLFLNGQPVGSGPHRDFNDTLTIEHHDISPHLRPGANELCALVRHLYLDTFGYLRSQPLFGCKGTIEGLDLSTGKAVWLYRHERRVHPFSPRINLHLGPLENQLLDRDGPASPPGDDHEPWQPAEIAQDRRELRECPLPPLEQHQVKLDPDARIVGTFDALPRLKGSIHRLGASGTRDVVALLEINSDSAPPEARIHIAIRGAGAVLCIDDERARLVVFPHGRHAGEGLLRCTGNDLRNGVRLTTFDADTLLIGSDTGPCPARCAWSGKAP